MMRARRRSTAALGRTGETCKGKEDAETSAGDERPAEADLAVRELLAGRRKAEARANRRREVACIGTL